MASLRLWPSLIRLRSGSCRTLNYFIHRSPFICRRTLSTAEADFDVTTEDDLGVAVLRMKKAPVNSLSLQTLTNLNIALDKLEQDDRINGLVITSVIPKIFCAGLELTELYQPRKENLRELWRALQEFWLKLYGSRLVTVAAINGHCIAGGCLIAVCCDYRIMASGSYKIGLNESQIGIEAPLWLMDSMVNITGQRIGEKALKLGQLFLPDEALKIGLVDEVVAETNVLELARCEAKKWLQVPDHARQLTKEALRKPTIDRMIARWDDSLSYISDLVSSSVTQEILGTYLESLKKKK